MKKDLLTLGAILITLFFLFKASNADAQTDILLGQYSHHIKAAPEYLGEWNESHDLIGVQVGDIKFAAFNNSYGNLSVGIGKVRRFKQSEKFDTSLTTGFVTGYDILPVMPMLIGTVTYKFSKRVAVDFNGMLDGTVGLGLRVMLDD